MGGGKAGDGPGDVRERNRRHCVGSVGRTPLPILGVSRESYLTSNPRGEAMRLRFTFPAPASAAGMETDAARRLAEKAAHIANVRLDVRHVHVFKDRLRVEIRCGLKLRDRGNLPKNVPLPYQRVSAAPSRFIDGARALRRVAAVCWHGHRDFFAALYSLAENGLDKDAPALRIVTGLATYNDREHFERTFPASDRNIGNAYHPVMASEACLCEGED